MIQVLQIVSNTAQLLTIILSWKIAPYRLQKLNEESGNSFLLREEFKKKTEKSDIVQKGRVGWTPKTYF